MIKDKKLLFIGAGNMAEALIQGVLNSKKVQVENVAFTEIRKERREYIHRKFGLKFFFTNKDGVAQADAVLFAVKPQNIEEVLSELEGSGSSPKTFITIAAGIPIQRFEQHLGQGARVIRVMPNMAALIGSGISGISRGQFATKEDETLACEIMGAVGEVVQLPERLLDAVTAVSGSGPAYFFYVMEALQEAAVRLGLDPAVSAKLVQCTAIGASLLIRQTQDTPEILRRKVTSPGGTTEAAVRVFEEKRLKDIFIQAIQAAEARSKELSQVQS